MNAAHMPSAPGIVNCVVIDVHFLASPVSRGTGSLSGASFEHWHHVLADVLADAGLTYAAVLLLLR